MPEYAGQHREYDPMFNWCNRCKKDPKQEDPKTKPALQYSCFEAVPKGGQYYAVLEICHFAAPFVGPAVDMFIASGLSLMYSELTRNLLEKPLKATNLLMLMQLCSQWMLPVLASILLDENCIGGWKIFWGVCEGELFDWKVFGHEVLSTREICRQQSRRTLGGRCSRAVIQNLSPLLLQKTLVKAILLPAGLCIAWRLLQWLGWWFKDSTQLGCIATRLTKPMKSMGQHANLMTLLEQAIVWGPLAPFLSAAIVAAVAHNFMLVHFAWRSHVPFSNIQPDTTPDEAMHDHQDEANNAACLSSSMITHALVAGWGFQFWFAWGNGMCGASLLIPVGMLIFIPDAKLEHWLPGPSRAWLQSLARGKPEMAPVEIEMQGSMLAPFDRRP